MRTTSKPPASSPVVSHRGLIGEVFRYSDYHSHHNHRNEKCRDRRRTLSPYFDGLSSGLPDPCRLVQEVIHLPGKLAGARVLTQTVMIPIARALPIYSVSPGCIGTTSCGGHTWDGLTTLPFPLVPISPVRAA